MAKEVLLPRLIVGTDALMKGKSARIITPSIKTSSKAKVTKADARPLRELNAVKELNPVKVTSSNMRIQKTVLAEFNNAYIHDVIEVPWAKAPPFINGVGAIIEMAHGASLSKEVEFYKHIPLLQQMAPDKTGLDGVVMGNATGGHGVTRNGWLPPRRAPFGYTPIRREQPNE